MNALWSYSLAAIGILGIYLAGRKSWVGWAIGVGSQVLWFIYAIATSQHGFILSAVAYSAIYARNWWKWTRPTAEPTQEDRALD